MKDWRGLVRKVIGETEVSVGNYVDLSLRLPKLFVLKPNEGIGKEFLTNLGKFHDEMESAESEEQASEVAESVYRLASEFSETQKKQVEKVITDVTASAEDMLKKLTGYVEVQSDRIDEIENIRSSISAAQSAETLDGMREKLTQGLDSLQHMVTTELKRQTELRTDHESYAARLQVKLETVEKESRTDVLTSVANRNGCMKKINAVIDYVKTNNVEYRLVLLDLNGFKQINDTLGHNAGDAALIAFSQRLTAAVGKENFVGRLAGDEFIVITNSPAVVINSLLNKLQEQFIMLPPNFKGIQLELSFCYGISLITKNSDSASILEQADIMLYKHKNDFYSAA